MKKLIIFNWKMNPSRYAEAEKLVKSVILLTKKSKKSEMVICPPFTWLTDLSHKYFKDISFGAQNIFWEEKGAYTGEISAAMLKNSKVEYVIIGHSERRRYLGETDEMINRKVLTALQIGLKVVLCVGEDMKTRRHGKKTVMSFIKKQLEKDLKGILSFVISRKSLVRNLVIAYEPIWAIGTGIPCKPEDALEIIKFIKKILNSKFKIHNSRVLYGGSVDGKNIESFIKYKEIDGALVGGASLEPKQFNKII